MDCGAQGGRLVWSKHSGGTVIHHFIAAALGGALVALPVAARAPARHHAGPPNWSYSGPDGLERWSALAENYRLCSTGRVQSPMD
jgi:carbonic anhydrase